MIQKKHTSESLPLVMVKVILRMQQNFPIKNIISLLIVKQHISMTFGDLIANLISALHKMVHGNMIGQGFALVIRLQLKILVF